MPSEGACDLACKAHLNRFLQGRVALTHDLVHDRRLHTRGLELSRGLADIDGIELLRVAHQHHARDTERVGDAQEIAGLYGQGEQALVYHQDGLGEHRLHLARARSPTRTVLTALPRCNDCPWVFASARGKPVSLDKAWKAVREARRR